MAPAVSKVSKQLGPEDVVFFVATKKVAPAIQNLVDVLHESAQGLINSASAQGAKAAMEACEILKRASSAVGAVIEETSSRTGAIIKQGCSGWFQAFVNCQGAFTEALPIVFVLYLLKLLYCAFVFAYMPAAGIAFTSPTSLIFHSFIFLTLASFYKAATTDPGSPPMSNTWRTYGRPPLMITERSRDGKHARWSEEEGCYKPDRAHYCKALGYTVLRMDHHCPWIGNTVGFHNHKFFYLFLIYATTTCAYFGVNILHMLVAITLPALSTFLLIGAEGLVILLLSILGPFLAFHTWLLINNMTTVEFAASYAKRDSEKDADCEKGSKQGNGESHEKSPYDVGLYKNVRQVLGDNPILWFVPVQGSTRAGLSFELNAQAAESRANQPPVADGKRRCQVATFALGADAEFENKGSENDLASTQSGGNPMENSAKTSDGDQSSDEQGGLRLDEAGSFASEDEVQCDKSDDESKVCVSHWMRYGGFLEDFSAGLGFVGERMVQGTHDAANRFSAACVGGRCEEQKARRLSWTRVGKRSMRETTRRPSLSDPVYENKDDSP